MRTIMMSSIALGLLLQVGCGNKEAAPDEAEVDPTVQVEDEPVQPTVVAPLELLPDETDERLEEPEDDVAFTVPATNAVHRRAGRSALPEQDETFAQPIPAKKLSDEDQFAEAVDESDIPDIVPWDQAKKYIGYEITVEGKIVDIGQTRDGSVNFLNFHKNWRGKFYMVVFEDLAKTLPNSIEATFLNKTLRVTGEVEDHRGRPQIKILSMDQVEFVGE